MKEPKGEESSNSPSKSNSSSSWWPEAVSEYIRASDEKLLAATPELLSFFEGDLLPIESVEEFLDVTGKFSAFHSFCNLSLSGLSLSSKLTVDSMPFIIVSISN